MGQADDGMWDPAEEVVLPSAHPTMSGDAGTLTRPQLEQAFHRLVLLYRLAGQICSKAEIEQVFDTVLSAVTLLLEVERAFVAMAVDGTLRVRAAKGIELGNDAATWPVSTTMLRRVLDENVSILTSDAAQDAQYGRVHSVGEHGIRSVICCPLGRPRVPRGLIYADNRARARAFSCEDLEFLNALAGFALLAIENAEDRHQAKVAAELATTELDNLRREIRQHTEIIGNSRSLINAFGTAQKAARKDVTVMIIGETGTGKEIFARLIHEQSPRKGGPFVAVNLSALPATLIESELFGHEKDAFTGANRQRIGRFEMAHEGTLFLDEILDAPIEMQSKLLRVLEQHSFERVGGNRLLQSNARIICACNKDPQIAVASGAFRQDLYYRLNALTLELPPLRKRREDIAPLAEHFLRVCGSTKQLAEDAIEYLLAYDWPGNVRELRHCVESLDTLVDGHLIRAADLPGRFRSTKGTHVELEGAFESLPNLVGRVEREHFRRAIERSKGRSEAAIRLLGIARDTFFRKKKEYGL
jgi:Nif-specific regulatory protein